MVRLIPSDTPLDRMLGHCMADRVQYGQAFHLVMVLFFALGTQAGSTHRAASVFFFFLLLVTGFGRFWSARVRLRYGNQESVPAEVNRRMIQLYLVHLVAWNLYIGYLLHTCLGDQIAEAIILICVAGTTSAAANSLSSWSSICYLYIVTQVLVVFTWSVLATEHLGIVIVVITLVYLFIQLLMYKTQCESTEAMFAAQLELRANSEELRKARDAAEEASKARSRFLASMSHEIRTPLNGLLGLAQILRDDAQVDPAQRTEMLETMIRSGDHLRSIVDDILDYSKIGAGRMVFEQAAVDLEQLLRETVESLRPAARSKSLGLNITILPGTVTTVIGDAVRLRQIVLNLLSNAVKFTSTGGVEVRLEPGHCNPEHTRIEVIDSGIGIAPEDQKRLFQDFQQLDASTKRRFGGTGLGLAITKSLVEQMGGTIAVESAPGKGSRFVVEIPFPKAVESPAVAEQVPGNVSSMPVRQGLRILVAEDNPVNQRIAQVMLRETGASVTLVENGAQAVRLHAENPFDLIFMDGNMPEMDGFEATGLIRGLPDAAGKVPIIALTANALKEDRDHCLASGMTDYLAKPFRREQLHSMVGRYAGNEAVLMRLQ